MIIAAAGLLFQWRPVSGQGEYPSYTIECVTGMEEVYAPSPIDGKCYCGNTVLDPESGYANGHCSPYPPDEGYSFVGCELGGYGLPGSCGYFCDCKAIFDDPSHTRIGCCHPRKDQYQHDYKVVAETTTSGPTTTRRPDMVWNVRFLTTTSTTSVPFSGATKVVGFLELTTVIPWTMTPQEWFTDADVKEGIAFGFATKLGVPQDWVSTYLSIPQNYTQVDYEILVPAGSKGLYSGIGIEYSIILSDTEDGLLEWGDAIGLGLISATQMNYSVSVHSVPRPIVVRAYGKTNHAATAIFGVFPLFVSLVTAKLNS
jgi:hypothetical protein